MSDSSVLDKTFHIIMNRMVQSGQAPHFTEIASELGLPMEDGRKALHDLFELGVGGWLFPNTDLIAMADQSLDNAIEVMKLMVEAETTCADFYQACSEVFYHDKDFWDQLVKEESHHAGVLVKLSELVTRKPQELEVGKLSPLSALRSFISRVQSDHQNLDRGVLSEKGALMAAYLIESTVVEHKYMEVIKTQNRGYLTALKNLMKAEVNHKDQPSSCSC
jgi:hypothetical protein